MEEETTKEGGKEESIYINTKKGLLLNIGTKKIFFEGMLSFGAFFVFI